MKELDDFTVERLEQLINFTHENGMSHATRPEWQALARIALAAKTAELVAFRVGDRLFSSLYSAGCYSSEMRLTIEPLYLDAQPNSPELPDGWIKCSERMPADCQTVLCNNMLTELSGVPFIADYVGMFELYDGTKYEAGFYINREPQTVTHWMPLPAPPTTGK